MYSPNTRLAMQIAVSPTAKYRAEMFCGRRVTAKGSTQAASEHEINNAFAQLGYRAPSHNGVATAADTAPMATAMYRDRFSRRRVDSALIPLHREDRTRWNLQLPTSLPARLRSARSTTQSDSSAYRIQGISVSC